MNGCCTCGAVSYQLQREPLFVHCCHCSWCQRETGSAFAVNALIESEAVAVLQGEPELIRLSSASGQGQDIARCRNCRVALWSHYCGLRAPILFVRVGTLDDPASCPPDIHIFTSTKQPWLTLGGQVPVMPGYYRRSEHWPDASLERYRALAGSSS